MNGVVLLYMGGPASLDQVKPFLRRLFADREIIQLPGGPALQGMLARIIVHFRTPRVERYYAEIGGGSPLLATTQEQARLLEAALAGEGQWAVSVAMRYCEPFAEQAVEDLRRRGIERLVALPLYPHFSAATSGSSFNALDRALSAAGATWPLAKVGDFHDHPGFLDLMSSTLQRSLQEAGDPPPAVVFCAHSLPVSFIQRGDPYQRQVETTVREIVRRTDLASRSIRWELGYQSRSGPVQWLEPELRGLCDRLLEGGERRLLVVPVSFVSDHIETLHEIDRRLGPRCLERGASWFSRTPAPGTSPAFIAALKDMVLTACKEIET